MKPSFWADFCQKTAVCPLICLALCLSLPACSGAQAPNQPLPHQEGDTPAAPHAQVAIAPVWLPLRERLATDGISGPAVDALLATLPQPPTQSPMGRKIRELYQRKFFPKPSVKKRNLYYKGVVTQANAATCRRFVADNHTAFTLAEKQYGVFGKRIAHLPILLHHGRRFVFCGHLFFLTDLLFYISFKQIDFYGFFNYFINFQPVFYKYADF